MDQPGEMTSYKWIFEQENDSLFYNVVRESVFIETDNYIDELGVSLVIFIFSSL